MGVAHFAGLGAEVEPVLVRDRAGADDPAAAQAVGEADLIYLSGGKPGHLRGRSTGARWAPPCGRPRARCGAGRLLGRGDGPGRPRVRIPGPLAAVAAALGAGTRASRRGVSVIPHYDAWPEPLSALIALQAPRGSVVLGIDEETAVIGRDGAMAGPRRRARHRLAWPPPRTVPRRRDVPDLAPASQPGRGTGLPRNQQRSD